VFPQGRQCELRVGYDRNENVENLCLRATLRHGIGVVEEFLEATNASGGDQQRRNFITNMNTNLDKLSESYMEQVLENAHYLIKLGFINQDLPAWKGALGVVRLIESQKARRQNRTSVPQAARVSALDFSRSLNRGMPELERRLAESGAKQHEIEMTDGELKHQNSEAAQLMTEPDVLENAA
jgi:hypothetical protein